MCQVFFLAWSIFVFSADDEDDEQDDDDDDDSCGLLDQVMEEEEEDEEDLSEDSGSQLSSLVSKMKRTDLSFPKETDFRKLTEGMDDLGESEEGETDDEGESEEDEEDEEEDSEDNDEENEGGVMTFSKEKVDEEVEKGRAVKNQLGMCFVQKRAGNSGCFDQHD